MEKKSERPLLEKRSPGVMGVSRGDSLAKFDRRSNRIVRTGLSEAYFGNYQGIGRSMDPRAAACEIFRHMPFLLLARVTLVMSFGRHLLGEPLPLCQHRPQTHEYADFAL